MAKNLTKKMKYRLEKDGDTIKHVAVRLIWNGSVYTETTSARKPKFDADLTTALLQHVGYDESDNPVLNVFAEDEMNINYYGNIEEPETTYTTPNGEIFNNGDCRTGEEGEEHQIFFDKVDPLVVEIPVIGTIHKGKERKQNWGVLNAKMILENLDSGEILAEYDLSADVGDCTAFHAGSFYRDGDNWEFQTMGVGYPTGVLLDFFESWEKSPVKPL